MGKEFRKMERLTGEYTRWNCACRHRLFFDVYEIADRLAIIEDILGDDYDLDRIQELAQAGREGRLVMLDEPRKPLIWGDDNHDSILCPNCKHDLMGGFQEADSCEVPMYQCPYCGQPIDGTQALTHEEAEPSGT